MLLQQVDSEEILFKEAILRQRQGEWKSSPKHDPKKQGTITEGSAKITEITMTTLR